MRRRTTMGGLSWALGFGVALGAAGCGQGEGGQCHGDSCARVASSTSSLTVQGISVLENLCSGLARNGVLDPGEECDNTSLAIGTCTDTCQVNLCVGGAPNAHVDNDGATMFEECDGDDPVTGIRCTPTCHVDLCVGGAPNGTLQAGEECDTTVATGRCTPACRLNLCAGQIPDGMFYPGEECDDGDGNNKNQCTTYCRKAGCGDGFVQASEQCDDGNASDADKCLTWDAVSKTGCTWTTCGDGKIDAPREQCDDGAAANGDTAACTLSCKSAVCGDGLVWTGHETCDDGAANNDGWGLTRHCNTTCGWAPYCGDGAPNSSEVCDDGAGNSDAWATARHCRADCGGWAPHCGDAARNGSEACDDGGANGQYGKCNASCTGLGDHCGDSTVNKPQESCDEGPNPVVTCAYGASSCAVCENCTTVNKVGSCCGDAIVDSANGEQCDTGASRAWTADCRVDCKSATCGDGFAWAGHEECDQGASNANAGACTLACKNAFCGDGLVRAGVETCDEAGLNGAYGHCNSTCNGPGPRCGDGVVNGSEACDDGSAANSGWALAKHCGANCTWAPYCGDGTVNGSEGCDNGAANANTGSCTTACQPARCGDGFKQGTETCDDGPLNGTYGNHCNSTCNGRTPFCGDGVVNGTEVCDGGAGNSDAWSLGVHCNASCTGWGPFCGDNVLNGSEQCDTGAGNSDTGACTKSCRNAVCGDGLTRAGVEECDDANASNNDSCTNLCRIARCGDELVRSGVEQCDLGLSNSNGGSCTLQCMNAVCGDGFTWLGHEACDEGAAVNGSYGHCNGTCNGRSIYCGDGAVNGPEVCDQGAANSNAWALGIHCNATCSGWGPFCGDEVRNGSEECDLGTVRNTGAYGTCTSSCTLAGRCGDATCQAEERFGTTTNCPSDCVGVACDDRNACTSGETYQANGLCGNGTVRSCAARTTVTACRADVCTTAGMRTRETTEYVCNPTTGACDPTTTTIIDEECVAKLKTCGAGQMCCEPGVCAPARGECP